MKTVFFFPHGQTAVTNKGQQVPKLQKAWLGLFLEFLESEGEDPTTFSFQLPDGTTIRVFKTADGYSWPADSEVKHQKGS